MLYLNFSSDELLNYFKNGKTGPALHTITQDCSHLWVIQSNGQSGWDGGWVVDEFETSIWCYKVSTNVIF